VVTLFCDKGEKYLQDYFMGSVVQDDSELAEPSPFV
jgi:cysteine synthase A